MHQFVSQIFSFEVAIFLFAYCLVFCGLYFLIYHELSKKHLCPELGKISFELTSLIQFVIWIPVGFGCFKINYIYLFLLPMVRELFDFILIFYIEREKFTSYYKKFIITHHVNSIITRVVLLIICFLVFKDNISLFLSLGLLYYCCSIFLVAPGALEKILFGDLKSLKLAYFKVINFIMARISHSMVVLVLFFNIWKDIPVFKAILFSIFILVFLIINEYQSISSGFSKIKNSLQIIQTEILSFIIKFKSNF